MPAATVRDNDGSIPVTPQRFREIRRLFDAAVLEAPPDRAAWVAEACQGAHDLRAQVEALLDADAVTGVELPIRPLHLVKGTADLAVSKLEGRRICVELLQELAEIPGVAGAHVMAPMNFAEIPLAIEESGVLNKQRKAA